MLVSCIMQSGIYVCTLNDEMNMRKGERREKKSKREREKKKEMKTEKKKRGGK